MIGNIRNIYQLNAYLQVQRILYLFLLVGYVKRYTTGAEPAVNRIEGDGEAAITVPEVFYDPITNGAITEDYETDTLPLRTTTLKAGQKVLFDKETKEPIKTGSYQKIVYTVYGVDIELKIEPGVIVLNKEGYTKADTAFRYNILPPEYNAIIADIDLYMVDDAGNEEWIGYLIGNSTQGQGASVLAAGAEFDINKKYEAEVVLNRGSDVEIRSERVEIKLVNLYIEKQDPEYPDVKLRWNDYYPVLGGKIITVRTTQNSLEGKVITCGILQTTLDAIANINPPPTLTCEPVDQQITGGRIRFRLTGEELAPRINNDPATGIDEIEIGFSLEQDGKIYENIIQATYNVKNNYNTTLEEILEGQAVFALDIDSTGDVKTGGNHQGKTTGDTDNEKGLDFVQKMINHIIVPLRTPANEANIKNTLPVYGYYGDMTKQALEAIINGGADQTGTTLKDTKVSHHINEENSLNTFKKLVKDYSGINETDIGKVIDMEILIGLNKSKEDKHPTDDKDIGIYELYLNEDWDEDGLSNYVEVENGIDPLVANPEYTEPADSSNPDVSVERGTYNNGLIENSLRIANINKGYYYFRSGDIIDDTDNYAPLRGLQLIEAVAKEWESKYPDLAPLKKNIFANGDNVTNLDDNDDDGNGALVLFCRLN